MDQNWITFDQPKTKKRSFGNIDKDWIRLSPQSADKPDPIQSVPSHVPPKTQPIISDALIVLSLCDRTANMIQPWAEVGFECICVDLRHPKCERRRGNITLIGADIRTWQPPSFRYGIVFAFPPCTNLAVSGAAWFRSKGLRGLREGIELVEACERICDQSQAPWMIENPVSTLATYWRKPDYTFNPLDFGGYSGGENDGYTKKTCLWVGNGFRFPEMKPIPVDKPNYIHHMSPSSQRSDLRSATPKGFARAVFAANVEHLRKKGCMSQTEKADAFEPHSVAKQGG